ARVNLASVLWSQGALDAARARAEEAVAEIPALAEAWVILGAIQLDSGLPLEAVEAYAQASRLKPDLVAARAGHAAALLAAGDAAAACNVAQAALAQDPTNAHAAGTLGIALATLGETEAAIVVYDHAVQVDPCNARARLNRGNAKLDLDLIDAAEADMRAAITLDSALKEAHASLGFLLTLQGYLPEAIAACEAALALDAEFAVAHWNLGVAALLEGDFQRGFAEYEWRKRHPVFGRDFIRGTQPEWTGEPLEGRHLLVRAEQGFGDTIMLARFLPLLARQAARVTLHCPRTVMPLLGNLGIGLVPLDEPPPQHDLMVDQMSLPLRLGITEATIPDRINYLTADPTRVARWQAMLPSRLARRVGLVWAGNPAHNNDRRRSLPNGALAPLLGLTDIHFVSLQVGARAGEYPITDISPLLVDYAETAAVIANLDAVVTVDTSVAHLAGAMGIPCHVLLSFATDWRWQLRRPDSPWYASITLHRQADAGDWSGPIGSVMAALSRAESG
ncbi:MAG TPA: tetratricopeptide repeat protein, partial [Acetobacteraceae bacterium]|nr:tetratricopeptide repeat protein [Acetobacteraceae bacterium]